MFHLSLACIQLMRFTCPIFHKRMLLLFLTKLFLTFLQSSLYHFVLADLYYVRRDVKLDSLTHSGFTGW